MFFFFFAKCPFRNKIILYGDFKNNSSFLLSLFMLLLFLYVRIYIRRSKLILFIRIGHTHKKAHINKLKKKKKIIIIIINKNK